MEIIFMIITICVPENPSICLMQNLVNNPKTRQMTLMTFPERSQCFKIIHNVSLNFYAKISRTCTINFGAKFQTLKMKSKKVQKIKKIRENQNSKYSKKKGK